MTTILRREFAPISSDAWAELDEEAQRLFKQNLVARHVVDFDGPHGWEFGAVNLGRLDESGAKGKSSSTGVPWGIRKNLPLLEIRLPFKLDRMEIDGISRGSQDADLQPLQDAVVKAAQFEDDAVFNGFKQASIEGIVETSEQKAISLPGNPGETPAAVAQAVENLKSAGIDEPFYLLLPPKHYYQLVGSSAGGYPPQRVIEDMIGGSILPCSVLKNGLVVSARGGDFQLTVGQDFSLGYASHDDKSVEFFITETFTFRVVEPNATVVLQSSARK